MKKKILLVLLTVFFAFTAFCYDGTVLGGLDGVMSRYEFIQGANDPDALLALLDPNNELGIQRFFQITEDTIDEEDVNFLDDLERYINEKYSVKENEAYSFIVFRNKSETLLDGWIVLYHYAPKNKNQNLYFLYYFSTEE